MLSFVILAPLLLAAQFTSGQPTVNFPINSQLPPVARVDEPFSYSFSRYTFRSDFNLLYSLGDAPEWLSIDDEGQLYGTPTDDTVPKGDVVGQQVEVIANDGAGSASLNATLVVSRNNGPSIKIPLSDQIGDFGDYSAPSSLISYPSTEFSFSFDPDTFDHQPDMINYYATSGDSSPLPAWMRFDAGSLTFSGETPPFESLIQPPQTFDFDLVASDIVGFSAVSMSFSIIVGSHKLSTDSPTITLNATRGKKLQYDGLEDSVKLDNKPIDKSDVEVSVDNMPEWLSLDEETWRIEGTPKKGDHSTNFTINLRDSHQDTLAIDAVVNVATALFRSTFDDIEIRAGKEANIDLEPYFWDPDDVAVEISVKPDRDWLKLEGFNITGKVPRSASGDLKISVTASSKSSDATETESLNVSLLAFTPTPSSTRRTSTSSTSTKTSSSTASSAPTETTSEPEPPTGGSSKGLSTSSLLLAILLPLLAFILLLMLLIFCLIRRRRSRQTYLSAKFRNKISGPVLESLRVNGATSTMQEPGKATNIAPMEQRLYRPTRQRYSEIESETLSLSSPTLETMGTMTTPEVPSRFVAEGSSFMMSRSTSITSGDDRRRSWVTVEGTATATARQSQASLRSQHSDTTFPESTHQLIPPPAFLSESGGSSFRSGLDLTIPSIDDLPNIGGPRTFGHGHELGQSGTFSSGNESSLAFASSHQSSPRLLTGGFPISAAGTHDQHHAGQDQASPGEAGQSIREIRRPEPVRLSSHELLGEGSRPSSRAWYDRDVSRGFFMDPSFGSTENWRVLGARRDATSLSYRQLVDEAPFHPARSSTPMSPSQDWLQPGERAGSDLISPSQWGDAQTSIRGSLPSLQGSHSHRHNLANSRDLRTEEDQATNWRREDSAKSKGGSYAFL
ncbi:uncharacterized protein NECHADRAFT_40623 [Fusarium vanettenii 77-13-4]|uniref:Dystroglycan-type cadherin-like domain-containing protein n=1 Tax=Fusarium vanettenii (strain ATCC MYA-4622 / CBS 123669 / FGSC 9596 / NRRL 45880 / 77-13-4) TaxID=660122 RepID=C7YS02_FUSV7|nr:uncharacterized protein NECHADRAFT_40623 [Fusarium vanettenii 77-13-4]EEU45554.1 hypothetical protein NECHADRAFT_40623 [Fusarium vanettenii 77-13-4]